MQATYTDGPPVAVSCGVFYFNRTWQLQDACGNATSSQVQRITVRDLTAPSIVSTNSPYDPDIDDYQCGEAFTYETGPATCFTLRTIARPSWADACGGTVTRTHGANNSVLLSSFGDFVAGNFPSGTTVVTFSATDCAGNSASCSLTVTVNDWQYPVLAGCQTDRVLSADPGLCSRQFFPTTPEASDNCAITSVLYSMSGATSSQGTGFPNALTCNVGLTTVTYRVSDEAGNVRSCSFNVTVVDQSPPTALCRDASVSLNPQQQAVITAVSVDNSSYDNCQYVVLSVAPSVFSCANLVPTRSRCRCPTALIHLPVLLL